MYSIPRIWAAWPHLSQQARRDLTVPIVEEYRLETREGKTVLRLVHSGIPDAAEWDGFYEGTRAGWPMFFICLRHYLERHAGRHRDIVVLMEQISDSPQAASDKFRTASGIVAVGEERQLAKGERYRAKVGKALGLEGRIELYNPPKVLVMTAENLDDSMLALSFEQQHGMNFTYIALSIYGWDQERIQALREQWLAWLKELFPAPGAPPQSR